MNPSKLSPRVWASLIVFGLFGQLAWTCLLYTSPAHAFYEKQGFVKKGYGYAKWLRP